MKKLSVAVTLLVFLVASAVQAQIDGKVNLGFTDKVNGWLAENSVPAAGIGVIENGKIKYVKVFGELRKGVPAPDNAIFNVASVTKTVVTMLTLRLVESGQWDLDQPLSDYWVDPDIANDSMLAKLTTRLVLTHETGFPNWRRERPDGKLAFEFQPGTKYQYSGEGYEYLRHALEHKFNRPLEKLTDSLLFKLLGMKDTHQSWDSTMDESRFAMWHDHDGNMYDMPYKTGVSAASDLLTTVEDYCKFGLFVMSGAGLSPKLFDNMVTPHSNIQKHSAVGLGWFIINGLPKGEYAIYHMGGNPGVKTIAVFLPKSKRGVVVFTNGENGMHVYDDVISAVFDIGDSICKYMYERPNMPTAVNVPDGLINEYVGHYKNPDVEISSKQSNEITLVVGGLPKSALYPESANKFFMRELDIQVEFVRDNAETVTGMILYYNGAKAFEATKSK
ncbi:MAG TPA: serine hydrolase domain-containing protein [Candidatus Kryptonia bacterium]